MSVYETTEFRELMCSKTIQISYTMLALKLSLLFRENGNEFQTSTFIKLTSVHSPLLYEYWYQWFEYIFKEYERVKQNANN